LKYSTGRLIFPQRTGGVGHDGSAAERNTAAGRAALLAAVKLQRLVELDVQLGHELAAILEMAACWGLSGSS